MTDFCYVIYKCINSAYKITYQHENKHEICNTCITHSNEQNLKLRATSPDVSKADIYKLLHTKKNSRRIRCLFHF